MRRGAGLHADETRRQRFEERQHLAAPELLANHDFLGRVDPVNLEQVLGDIQPDRANLHLDGSPHVRRERAPSTTSKADIAMQKGDFRFTPKSDVQC